MGLFKKSYCANCGKPVGGPTKFVKKNGKLLYYLCMDCESAYKKVTNGADNYPDTQDGVKAVIAGKDTSFTRSKYIEKTVEDVKRFFGDSLHKSIEAGIPDLLQSMEKDEEITFGFLGAHCTIANREQCLGYIVLLTNKKLYYSGISSIAHFPRTGSIDLTTIQAVTSGKNGALGYVNFDAMQNTWHFSTAQEAAVREALDTAIRTAKEAGKQPDSQNPVSVADELKKFKELLDLNIITQEEFDAKKKQLLGL